MKKQVKNGMIKVLVMFLILAGAYGLWCHFLTDNVIWKKLKINGISIQGMSKEEAIDAISKDLLLGMVPGLLMELTASN